MSITADRITRGSSIHSGKAPRRGESCMVDGLIGALDSIVVGVIIVGEQGRIVHANLAAQSMFAAKSPIVALGGHLCALQGDITKELKGAIAAAQHDPERISGAGIGVPLVDRYLMPATAHVLPVTRNGSYISDAAAVFVTPPRSALPIEISTVMRIFNLTPAEARLLQHLVSGASLIEAATTLGISEATARTHRNHIFNKTGVSRRTDLLVLIGHLVPPVHSSHR